MPKALLLCALVALPFLGYGASAGNTIGGLNFFATILAMTIAGLALAAGAAGLALRRGSRRAVLLSMVANAAIGALAVAVLLSREFALGYGP